VSKSLTGIVTTIQEPTPSVRCLVEAIDRIDGALLVIGDAKGPTRFDVPRSEFFSLEDQLRLPFTLAPLLPVGHYARKNLGYLISFSRRARLLYETDDDNAPNDAWRIRTLRTDAQKLTQRTWANVYRLFRNDLIWPRGFPLDLVNNPSTFAHDIQAPLESFECPIQQGLADSSPDVDAVWRLLLGGEFIFPPSQSVWLPPGTWCPFNSQSTWWWPVAYPLMYLPSHCSFRMTDIWRSFIAQRCLWELGRGLVFHPPEVIQERNVHNLMRDFEQEVPGYLQNQQIARTLTDLSLTSGAGALADNLMSCYEAMVAKGIIPALELPLVKAWLDDLDSLG
jgi:STELLO glycosyltransferases